MKKLLLIICMSFLCMEAFCALIEKASVSGALFNVVEAPKAQIGVFTRADRTLSGMLPYIFEENDNQYDVKSFPRELLGLRFYLLPINKSFTYKFESDGEILALVYADPKLKMDEKMKAIGFTKLENIKPFKLFRKNKNAMGVVYSKRVKSGETFVTPKPWCIVVGLNIDYYARNGETLYNGIVIPRKWPPRYGEDDKSFDPRSRKPFPVPYLKHKPSVIDISVGRQLFVDDFLIFKGDFDREYYLPKKYKGNPVFKPETPLEKGKVSPFQNIKRTSPMAAPLSGGLWWNQKKGVYEMWYNAGMHGTMAYAYSKDLKDWVRPELGLYDEPNQIMPDKMFVDCGAVLYDYFESDLSKVYKNFNIGGRNWRKGRIWYSADGYTFDYDKFVSTGLAGEASTVFYNPFRKKWVFSLRSCSFGRSDKFYLETDDFSEGARWSPEAPVYWLNADENDKPLRGIDVTTALYKSDCIAYESLMIGFLSIWYGPENFQCMIEGHPKYTGVKFAYSRDGFHFSRPDYRDAIKSERYGAAWDRGYVHMVNGGLTIHGDEMRLWYIASRGFGTPPNKPIEKITVEEMLASTILNGNISVGYATLRRDGFASVNSKADGKPAEILTEPISFAGSYLFVNVDAPKGALRAEVIGMDGKVIEPFSLANCEPVSVDSTRVRLTWKGGKNLGMLAHTPVRLRFVLENGKLYSFWVSVASNGRSDGYIGAGIPGCPSRIDTVGNGE